MTLSLDAGKYLTVLLPCLRKTMEIPFIFWIASILTLATAIKYCGRPPPAPKPGGVLKIVPAHRGHQYRYRTVVKYSCRAKYVLKGVRQRTCGKNGRWSPQGKKSRCVPVLCNSLPFALSSNVLQYTSHPGPQYPLGSEVNFSCSAPFVLSGPIRVICSVPGIWYPYQDVPQCVLESGCGSPPAPPWNSLSTENIATGKSYPVGWRVNYTCLNGHGFDGIPYRICGDDGQWWPSSLIHRCVSNLATCSDPGIPKNGFRRIQSFANFHSASFGCKAGYRHQGSYIRTCHASAANNSFWDGKDTECIDQFEDSDILAAQLRESFIDRTISCDTTTLRNSSSTNNNTVESGFCRGRTVVLGEGCVDLIYAIDCSGSAKHAFNESKDFISKTIRLFDLETGSERVSFATYDDKVYPQFGFDDVKSKREAMDLVQAAKFCGGSTSTNVLLDYVIANLLPTSRKECKKALFLFSDGQNNWGGAPLQKAETLKRSGKFEIYTVAIGTNSEGWNSLRAIASSPKHFFAVRDAKSIESIVKKAIKNSLDYENQCGLTAAEDDACKDELEDHCRSARGAWPWLVGIYVLKTEKSRPEIICGGALIGNCYVLTAAHCLHNRRDKHVLAVVGNTDRLVEENTEDTYAVCRVLIHHLYDPNTLDYDVALLKLCCNVTYSTYGRKLCLPDCDTDRSLYAAGTTCTVAGWGATEFNKDEQTYRLSTHLHHIHLPVSDIENCRKLSDFPVTDRMFCAGDASGDEGVCKGDSGGPLFCQRENHDSWVATGIVSWGEGCREANKYDIFTNICNENISSWIDEQQIIYPCQQCSDDADCSCGEDAAVPVNIV